MKSLFSCFPKRKSKSKFSKSLKNQPQVISETKCNIQNNCNIEKTIDDHKVVENNITVENQSILENESVHTNEVVFPKANNEELEMRLKNALARIENVYSILNYKNNMYIISNVIMDFKVLLNSELNEYIFQSEQLGDIFFLQASYVAELFNIQSELIASIESQDYTSIEGLNLKFKHCVVELNKFCGKDNDKFEFHRLIADSIMIFGWICCLNKPSSFTSNVIDGCVMVAAKMVNDTRYANYSIWLKSWTSFMKGFNSVITKHFEAALMWRIDGPIPMDIIRCLVECNYSNLKEEPIHVGKAKVVKTTAAKDISYETVTSLFDDLRSGRQKLKLRTVQKEEPVTEESPIINLGANEQVSETEPVDETITDKLDKPAYILRNKMWIINNETGNGDIEIPNKDSDNSVSISNCNDCSIQIDGIVDNITIENCFNISVISDEITGSIIAVDSTNIESQVLGTVSNVKLKEVSKFRLFVAKEGSENLVIVTSKCADIDLYVSNNEGGGLELEDYDQHIVGTHCRTELRDGVLSHTVE